MLYGKSNDHVTDVTLKGQGYALNMHRAQYLENSWRCYFATIANY